MKLCVQWEKEPAGKARGYVVGFLLNAEGVPGAVVEYGWDLIWMPLDKLKLVDG